MVAGNTTFAVVAGEGQSTLTVLARFSASVAGDASVDKTFQARKAAAASKDAMAAHNQVFPLGVAARTRTTCDRRWVRSP
jgi:hypothetical protein